MNFTRLILVGALAGVTLSLQITADDWPQWRGPDRNDISKETGLLKSWPEGGPKKVWIYENAGKGYSGPAIVGGKLYTLGTREDVEGVLALDANTGKELWFSKVGGLLQNKWGDGPRGTPAVDGERIYILTGSGILAALDRGDGKVSWQTKMEDLGGKVPYWGYTESVLVDGDQVVCTPGGEKGTIAAFNKTDGKLRWQSSDITDTAQYASIVPAEINGTKQYVQFVMTNIFAVSAKDGKLLWKTPFPGRTAMIPTPVVKDNYVYQTGGYGAGCKMVKIGAGNEVTEVYSNKVMKNHHGGVILLGNNLFGHSDGNGWVCQNFMTGEEVWSEKSKLNKGAIGYADGMFYCLEEGSGTVALVEASEKGWNEKSRFKLEPQSKIRSSDGRIWTHPVIAGGKLYLRDQDLIYCYDVKQ